MTGRQSVIATVLTVAAVTAYQFSQLSEGVRSDTLRSHLAMPVLEAPPVLALGAPLRSAIGSQSVWNLKAPASMPGGLPPLKDLFKPYYTLSKEGRFDAIQRSDRPSEKWQFQGVLSRGGRMQALFYNSGLKKVRVVAPGEAVDGQLVVGSIGSSSVTVEVVGEKKPQKFDLRVFDANKESYAVKRKKS